MNINKTIDKFFLSWPFNFSPFCLNVVFELTYLCNLNCSFCYLRNEEIKRKVKQKKILGKNEIFKIIDKIPKIASITFTGGEVFLIKDILEILKYARKNHRVGLISNLTLNTKKANEILTDIRINSLMFSLDGDKKLHDKIRGKGNFEKTINNILEIQKLKEKKNQKLPLLTMNTVIIPENFIFLDKLVKLASALKVDCLNFQLLDPSLERSGYQLFDKLNHLRNNLIKAPKINKIPLENLLKKAIKIAKKLKVKLTISPQLKMNQILDYYQGRFNSGDFYCSKIFTSLRISPWGEAYPCYNLRIGNILKNDFFKIFNSREYRNFRKQVKKGFYTKFCLGCCHFKLRKNL